MTGSGLKHRPLWSVACAGAMAAAGFLFVVAGASPAQALAPVNPVEVALDGHPANSGFLVFVEHNVTIRSDESEGSMALGGDLHLQSNYNIAAGSTPVRPTYTAPGDSGPTFLHVGGGVSWDDTGATVNVENQGFTKVANTATYDAYNRDRNNALVNYRLVPQGRPYETQPHIDGRTNQQTPASIGTPVPSSLIDIPSAFTTYRGLTQQMAGCPANVNLVDDQGNILPRPIPDGARGRLTLTPGRTNVLTLSSTDLRHLSEITYTNQPTASTPLLINVTGTSYLGNIPNQAGVSGNQAPYILWNFPDATKIVVNGGATIEGTLYAPSATLTWIPSQNIEGNIIAAAFNHGLPGLRAGLREIHDFPFSTTISCADAEPTAQLTLVKEVVNDDGGTADPSDWILTADGPTPVEGLSGSDDVTAVDVPPGDYTLGESEGPDGYVPSGWTCTAGVLSGDVLTLAAGQNATCTITNNDSPEVPGEPAHLTLVKQVVNDDGGTAVPTDWELSADGPTDVHGITGSPDITEALVDPGVYTLAETAGPPGYTAAAWTCTPGGADGANTVTIAAGDNVTCTIVNNDTTDAANRDATLTLVKNVINDDGGTAVPTDWTLTGAGPDTVAGRSGTVEVTGVGVRHGSYTLTESNGPAGYVASAWRCDAGAVSGNHVQIPAGGNVTCTITNDDEPGASPSAPATPSPSASPSASPTVRPSGGESGAPPAGADPGSGSGSLPGTGGPATGWLLLGLALTTAGAGALVLARRRPGSHRGQGVPGPDSV